jgi:asparagine synthase (glutamine-hydrolysing)
MTGNYGSEVLRGSRAFKPTISTADFYKEELRPYFCQAEETYSSHLQGHPVSFAVFKQAPWHHYGLLALEQTQVSIRSPYLDNDFVRTVFRAPASACSGPDISLRLIAEGNPALREIPTDRGIGGVGLRGALLNRTLEFLTKAEYAYDYGMPQWLARVDHILSPLHLERVFLGKQKFNHYRVWYRDALAGYVQEILLDQRTLSRPYVGRHKLRAMVEAHVNGRANYTNEIHIALSVELIYRLFIDPS